MRRFISITLCFLLLTTELFAKTSDWNNLNKLKAGDTINVSMKGGGDVEGEFHSFKDTSLRLAVFTSRDSGFGSFRDIERDKIRKIVRVNHPRLPNPHKLVTTGAIVGGAAGAITAAAHPMENVPPGGNVILGGLAGAAIGMVGSAAVGLGIGVHAMAHRSTLIYESK